MSLFQPLQRSTAKALYYCKQYTSHSHSTLTMMNMNAFNYVSRFKFSEMQKTDYASAEDLSLLRNIGISAHIDSGKTTTTERILFYTGRINAIHEVGGKDGIGAKMDSMALEREKGITIKSAATHTEWTTIDGKHYHINIIDTPGHVDFTIEVERALQVLDGAIMIVCACSGVQSQTITVDRQCKRYRVPRICFLNKCDRTGANPFKVIEEIRAELDLNAALTQIPIGVEEYHDGVIDIIEEKAYYFDGPNGEHIREEDIDGADAAGAEHLQLIHKYKLKLVEALGEVDEEMELHFLEETMPSKERLQAVIRACTFAQTFIPVFVGSAYKNKGVQLLLNGVINYLPSPLDRQHFAKDLSKLHLNPNPNPAQSAGTADEAQAPAPAPAPATATEVLLSTEKSDPLLCLAFKLEESQFGQLTWVKVYQGTLRKGMNIQPIENPLAHRSHSDLSANGGAVQVVQRAKKVRLNRLVRLHSSELQNIQTAYAGDICAMFGVECASGTTFSDGKLNHLLISDLHVPKPVLSISVKPKDKHEQTPFAKAIERFQREDPTFKCAMDDHTESCIFSGMGELHLQIYLERIEREYSVHCEVSKPRVSYKEGITASRVDFNYKHKKQTGGQGQFAHIIGYIESIDDGSPNPSRVYEFVNQIRGQGIPPHFVKSVDVGFKEMLEKGPMCGGPIEGLRVVLVDGSTHEVDSSDFAFRAAAKHCFRKHLQDLRPRISEPYMKIEIMLPSQFREVVIGDLNSRGLLIENISDSSDASGGGGGGAGGSGYGKNTIIQCVGALDCMFGYATDLRSFTQGKGEFSMEYRDHQFIDFERQEKLIEEYQLYVKEKEAANHQGYNARL